MNKTKRTLIVSSVVMALVLIVTVVSVTAAWFSNVASTKEDGFTINSTTLKESANITIGERKERHYPSHDEPNLSSIRRGYRLP